MTTIGLRERQAFIEIIIEDLTAIQSKVVEQIKDLWEESRIEILHNRGLDLKIDRKEEIKTNIKELQEELNQLEQELNSDKLTVHQTIELGGKVNRYDVGTGANFFGIPVTSQLEYDIVQKIKDKVDTEAPAKYLRDLGRSSLRELTMAGTFEQAQSIYNDFYSLDFRKYGVDIPPRLLEMKEARNVGDAFMLPDNDKKMLEASYKEKE